MRKISIHPAVSSLRYSEESRVAGVPSYIPDNIFESQEFENERVNEITIKLIAFYERRMWKLNKKMKIVYNHVVLLDAFHSENNHIITINWMYKYMLYVL